MKKIIGREKENPHRCFRNCGFREKMKIRENGSFSLGYTDMLRRPPEYRTHPEAGTVHSRGPIAGSCL